MVVGICKLELFFSESHSLKDKRMILRSLKEKTSQRFKILVSEVDHQDLWQRGEIGFALVGNDRGVIGSLLDQVTDSIEQLDLCQVTQRTADVIDF